VSHGILALKNAVRGNGALEAEDPMYQRPLGTIAHHQQNGIMESFTSAILGEKSPAVTVHRLT
jgi:hypothetical protein